MDKTVVLSSFSSNGGLLETVVVEEDREVVLQNIEPIANITASSDSIEAVIPFVCLQPIDIGEVINETVEEARRGSDTVNDQYSESPQRTSELKGDATRQINDLYMGRTNPNVFVSDMNTTLSSIGLPSMSIN